MRYGSVSSGIECASIAWAPLGWQPAFLAEIDPFASTVLHHHHSSGRPKNMPSPDEDGLTVKVRNARRAAIRAVASLPSDTNGPPNYGDMTTFEEWPDAIIDLLIRGTPCQTYSVAGLRKGLDDPRGDLTLTYAAIARRFRPRWLVWENVFGVLSHDRGRSFASLLGLLSGRRVETPKGGWKSSGIVEGYGRAYGLAWRVLDTQYVRIDGFGRAIPQRRRRVFIVGYLGDWRRAAAVLLERESMSGNPPPRRKAGQSVAGTIDGGAHPGSYNGQDAYNDKLVAGYRGNKRDISTDAVARCVTAGYAQRLDYETENFVAYGISPDCFDRDGEGAGGTAGERSGLGIDAGVAYSLRAKRPGGVAHAVAPVITSNPYGDHASREGLLVAHSLRADGFDASEDGTGRGTPIVPICFNSREDPEVTWDRSGPLGASHPQAQTIAFDTTQITSKENRSNPQDNDPCHPLASQAHVPVIAIQERAVSENVNAGPQGAGFSDAGASYTLEARHQVQSVQAGWAVRRLVTKECCRLQGVPDDYFDNVVWRGKSPPPDGPIYKTLGNGFSANVVRWIGRRIEMVEEIAKELVA